MDLGRRFCSVTPHEDIENGFQRQPIPYHLAIPDSGVNEDTGLIFFIDGFGGHPQDPYDTKMRPYLANKYNCLVASIEYFGINMKKPSLDEGILDENFFEVIEKATGVRFPDLSSYGARTIIETMAKWFVSSGVSSLPASALVQFKSDFYYQSFGIIPALDHLQVLSELIGLYQINKHRIFLSGTSYGGYIANLLGKLAPNTFQLIVDNSGFVQTRLIDTVGDSFSWTGVYSCRVPLCYKGVWSSKPEHECYFDDHNSEIRSLIERGHLYPSKSFYFSCHSSEDELVAADEKIRFKNLISDFAEIEFDLVDESKLDGKLYKNLCHGMNASLRDLFEKAYSHYQSGHRKTDDQTDFDRESEYDFPCSNGYSYHIKFTKDDVRLTLHPPE